MQTSSSAGSQNKIITISKFSLEALFDELKKVKPLSPFVFPQGDVVQAYQNAINTIKARHKDSKQQDQKDGGFLTFLKAIKAQLDKSSEPSEILLSILSEYQDYEFSFLPRKGNVRQNKQYNFKDLVEDILALVISGVNEGNLLTSGKKVAANTISKAFGPGEIEKYINALKQENCNVGFDCGSSKKFELGKVTSFKGGDIMQLFFTIVFDARAIEAQKQAFPTSDSDRKNHPINNTLSPAIVHFRDNLAFLLQDGDIKKIDKNILDKIKGFMPEERNQSDEAKRTIKLIDATKQENAKSSLADEIDNQSDSGVGSSPTTTPTGSEEDLSAQNSSSSISRQSSESGQNPNAEKFIVTFSNSKERIENFANYPLLQRYSSDTDSVGSTRDNDPEQDEGESFLVVEAKQNDEVYQNLSALPLEECFASRVAYKELRDNEAVTITYTKQEEGSKEPSNEKIDKYKVKEIINESGITCCMFLPEDKDDNKIRVVFRGTNSIQAAKRGLERINPGEKTFNEKSDQIIKKVFEEISKWKGNVDKKANLIFSGHSLGAADAQRATVKALEEIKNVTGREHLIEKVSTYYFNSPGIAKDTAEKANKLAEAVKDKGIKIECNAVIVESDGIQQFGEANIFTDISHDVVKSTVTCAKLDGVGRNRQSSWYPWQMLYAAHTAKPFCKKTGDQWSLRHASNEKGCDSLFTAVKKKWNSLVLQYGQSYAHGVFTWFYPAQQKKALKELHEFFNAVKEDHKFSEHIEDYIKATKFKAKASDGKDLEGDQLRDNALKQTVKDFDRNLSSARLTIRNIDVELPGDYQSKGEGKLDFIKKKFSELGINKEFRDAIIAEFNQGAKCDSALSFLQCVYLECFKDQGITFFPSFKRISSSFTSSNGVVNFSTELSLDQVKITNDNAEPICNINEKEFLKCKVSFNFVWNTEKQELSVGSVKIVTTPGATLQKFKEENAEYSKACNSEDENDKNLYLLIAFAKSKISEFKEKKDAPVLIRSSSSSDEEMTKQIAGAIEDTEHSESSPSVIAGGSADKSDLALDSAEEVDYSDALHFIFDETRAKAGEIVKTAIEKAKDKVNDEDKRGAESHSTIGNLGNTQQSEFQESSALIDALDLQHPHTEETKKNTQSRNDGLKRTNSDAHLQRSASRKSNRSASSVDPLTTTAAVGASTTPITRHPSLIDREDDKTEGDMHEPQQNAEDRTGTSAGKVKSNPSTQRIQINESQNVVHAATILSIDDEEEIKLKPSTKLRLSTKVSFGFSSVCGIASVTTVVLTCVFAKQISEFFTNLAKETQNNFLQRLFKNPTVLLGTYIAFLIIAAVASLIVGCVKMQNDKEDAVQAVNAAQPHVIIS